MDKKVIDALYADVKWAQDHPEDLAAGKKILDRAETLYQEAFSEREEDEFISTLLDNRFKFDGRDYGEDMTEEERQSCDDALRIFNMEAVKMAVDEFFENI